MSKPRKRGLKHHGNAPKRAAPVDLNVLCHRFHQVGVDFRALATAEAHLITCTRLEARDAPFWKAGQFYLGWFLQSNWTVLICRMTYNRCDATRTHLAGIVEDLASIGDADVEAVWNRIASGAEGTGDDPEMTQDGFRPISRSEFDSARAALPDAWDRFEDALKPIKTLRDQLHAHRDFDLDANDLPKLRHDSFGGDDRAAQYEKAREALDELMRHLLRIFHGRHSDAEDVSALARTVVEAFWSEVTLARDPRSTIARAP